MLKSNLGKMANQPISMSKVRHLLHLFAQGRSRLSISEQTGMSRNTVKKYLQQFHSSGLSFAEINQLEDKDIEELFLKPRENEPSEKLRELWALCPQIDKNLKKKGVTRQQCWLDYKSKYPNGYGLSQFKSYYMMWKGQVNPVMHMEHKVGDKMYVDFAGDHLSIVDKQTGEIQDVEIFVAVLGASQYTYVEAVMTQQKEDFIGACENALHYFGGVPAAIVPDNLKSAVKKSSKYEPIINETFADLRNITEPRFFLHGLIVQGIKHWWKMR